jgi:hypothetical protein
MAADEITRRKTEAMAVAVPVRRHRGGGLPERPVWAPTPLSRLVEADELLNQMSGLLESAAGATPDVPSPGTAATGANPARPSPSSSAARSATPHRLVHADGLDLTNVSAAIHIGMGCRVCERLDCPQYAAPPLGHPLRIDQDLAGSRLLARHQKSQQRVTVSPRTPGDSRPNMRNDVISEDRP